MATWGYVRPEKQTVGDQHRGAATVANTVAKPLNSTRRTWTTLEYRPSLRPVTDGPGRCAHSYGSDAPVGPHVVQTIPASSGAGWACIMRWSAPVSISSFSQIGACLSPGVNRCPNRTPGKL